jgi:acetoacetyl-CoA synthetase
MTAETPLWTPSPERVAASNMAAFMRRIEADWNISVASFPELHRFSVAEREKFWVSLRDFAGLTAATWGERVLIDGEKMPGAKFFPDAEMNFAENLLKRRDDGEAIVFWGEDKVRVRVTRRELYDRVSLMAQALKWRGVLPGDRVAGYLPNMPEAIIAMLAASAIGATWTSCSPDFGVQGVLDRFGQTEPKVLFAVDGYHYNGKTHDVRPKVAEVLEGLPTVEQTIIVPYADDAPDVSMLRGATLWDDFTEGFAPGEIDFVRRGFDHPLYILYSSGTTGKPKCIVHGQGGVLLQHVKEHQLHSDVKPDDRMFYFTTLGWMMWNWLVTGLASGATVMLYDGSPFYPDGNALFDFAEAEKFTLFGMSAKFVDAVNKAGLSPKDTHDLSSVRAVLTTGSPLVPEGFDYVYAEVKSDVHLASVSGGTDLCACFVIGDPTRPVWRGEIQAPALGMAVEVFDEAGVPLDSGKGELVCTKAFPSMPIGFWSDPDGSRYHAAYFEKFPGVWCHGDWVAWTEHGGIIIYGRSDATLNPGGVRIGTAEIYAQVEKLPEIKESIVIGQEWDNDTRIVLFVVLADGVALDDDLTARIKKQIRDNCTPRHVPAKVIAVADIPRTKSGKITELAVRDVIHGRPIKNREALANPEALELYKDLPELKS